RRSSDLERVIVLEEKRDFLERQVAAGIVGTSVRELVGKHDVDGARLFPVEGGMTSDMVADRRGRVLARSITLPDRGRERVRYLQQKTVQRSAALPVRAPNY